MQVRKASHTSAFPNVHLKRTAVEYRKGCVSCKPVFQRMFYKSSLNFYSEHLIIVKNANFFVYAAITEHHNLGSLNKFEIRFSVGQVLDDSCHSCLQVISYKSSNGREEKFLSLHSVRTLKSS